MSAIPGWIVEVKNLCLDAWDLSAAATDEVIASIQALIAAGEVTDAAIVEILVDAGVSEMAADIAAPLIVAAILG